MATVFSDWQNLVYFKGLAGELPAHPVDWGELERTAREAMAPGPRGYVFGGAGTGDTMRENLDAFRRRRIVPRHMRDHTARDMRTEVLGTAMPAPVMLAPVGVQSIIHPEGELASARAAAALGVPYCVSTAATRSMEEIAGQADGPRWYQLYWPKDDDITRSFVARAEAAGYSAIVVTLDTTILGWRPADLAQAYLPFLQGEGIGQYLTDPAFRATLEKTPEEDLMAAVGAWVGVFNKNMVWEDLAFLRSITELPIVLKGVLHPEDAELAREHGASGVIVSNHGGRQVDGAIGALDALPAVARAVGGDLAVLFDSGIRCGADVVKALALGADAVLVGRPFLWGLALDGEAGVTAVLQMLLAEFELTMALSGVARPADLSPASLQH